MSNPSANKTLACTTTIRSGKAHSARKRRIRKTSRFVYNTPLCPFLQPLLSEAFRSMNEYPNKILLTDEHCHALVLELMATRRTLDILCPDAELPAQVRRFVTELGLNKQPQQEV